MSGKSGKILLPAAIVIAGVLVAGALLFINKDKVGLSFGGKSLSAQEAGQKAIDYINNNQLTQSEASLVSAVAEKEIYKIRLKAGTQEYDSYITKDGKYLFPMAYDLTTTTESSSENTDTETKATCETLKRADKAVLEAFVVSKCPYGLQMQRILAEVVKNIPSLAENIRVEYIGAIEGGKITSMHGDAEAQENLRQICIREEQFGKYWGYTVCHIGKGDVDSCLTSVGVNTTKLNTCMTDSSKGLKYAAEDFAAQDQYQVSGSPTLFLNGEKVSEFDFGGRTAGALKTVLCCGFNTNLDICSQKLTEDAAATSFSETYASGSSSSNSAAGCE